MGLDTHLDPSSIKERLAQYDPDVVEDFFKFIDEQLEMNRSAHNGIKKITSKNKFYKEQLRLDKIEKLVLHLKS